MLPIAAPSRVGPASRRVAAWRCVLGPVLGALLGAVLCLASASALAQTTFLPEMPAAPSRPLPTDPALSQGALGNGVRYILRRHRAPEGHVFIRVRVAAGVAFDDPAAPGLATLTAHAAMGHAISSDLGRALANLADLVPAASRPEPVRLGPDFTEFTVAMPVADDDALISAFTVLRAVLSPEAVLPASIDAARPGLIDLSRRGCPLKQRIQAALMPQIAPGWAPGEHTPCVSEAALCDLDPGAVGAFHRRWYSSQNITVIVVGDASPAAMARALDRTFGSLAPKPRPTPPDLTLRALPGPRAAVVTDREIDDAVAEIVVLDARDQTVRDESALRDRLIDEAAAAAIRARLALVVASRPGRLKTADAWIGPIHGLVGATFLTVTGPPGDAGALASEVLSIAARLRASDLSEPEAAAAAAEVIAAADQDAQAEATSGSFAMLERTSAMLSKRRPLLAAMQRAELARTLLDGLTAAELTDRVAQRLDPRRASLALLVPDAAGAPSVDEVSRMLDSVTAPPAPMPAATSDDVVLPADPPPGRVVSIALHPASGVTTADLSSRVRVHQRSMAGRAGEVSIVVSIAGGSGEEPPDQHGVAAAAAALWESPAARSRPGRELRRALAGHHITLESSLLPDRLEVRLTTSADDLEPALQLLHLLLSEPVLETAAFDRWRSVAVRQADVSRQSPSRAADRTLATLLFPGNDPRQGRPSRAQIEALTPSSAQRWLDDRVMRAPIEVAIVGDADRAVVLDLAARYLGSIPPRPPLTPGEGICAPALPARSADVSMTIHAGPADAPGLALVAIPSLPTDAPGIAAARDIAARILTRRLGDERFTGLLTVEARRVGDEALSGPGLVYVAALADADALDAAINAVDHTLDDLAANPPAADELVIAQSQAQDDVRARAATPMRWAQHLAGLSVRGGAIDDLIRAPDRLAGVTSAAVAASLLDSQTGKPLPRLRVRVLPTSDGPR
jgi:zinc protease